MADVKIIVKQMKDAGMSYLDILSNLKELGIANAEEQLGRIAKELDVEKKPGQKGMTEQAGKESRKKEEPAFNLGKTGTNGDMEENEEKTEHITKRRGAAGEEEKMDKIIALLKSLHELNTKILESNRDILTKLERKSSSGGSGGGSSSSGKGGELF